MDPDLFARHDTPPELAARVVERVLGPLLDGTRESLAILDPACGGGVFLLEARRYLSGGGVSDRALYGMDRDFRAAGETRAALAPGNDFEVAVGDALLAAWKPSFDAVIGNPPWISLSGRQARRLPDATARAYAARYDSFAGWPSLHALFLEMAVRVLRPGGRAGLLVPARVCDLEGYAPVRRVLRAAGAVEAIDLGEDAFPGVVQPVCLLVVTRGESTEGGGAPFPLAADGEGAWRERFRGFPRPPREAFGDFGVHTGNAAARLLAGGTPMRCGRDVHAYRLSPASARLFADARPGAGERFRIGDADRYRRVPILLRQTAARPIAALHESPGYFRNSVLACNGIEGVPGELVVAWLNSSVVAAYHRESVRESGQRAFPQVKIRHLRDLPLPPFDRAGPKLRGLARAVAREGRLECAAELDAAISGLFGVYSDGSGQCPQRPCRG